MRREHYKRNVGMDTRDVKEEVHPAFIRQIVITDHQIISSCAKTLSGFRNTARRIDSEPFSGECKANERTNAWLVVDYKNADRSPSSRRLCSTLVFRVAR